MNKQQLFELFSSLSASESAASNCWIEIQFALSSPGHNLCSLVTVLEKNSPSCLMSFPFGMTRVFSLAQSPADPQQAAGSQALAAIGISP